MMSLPAFKLALKHFKQELCVDFCHNKSIVNITHELVTFIDHLIVQLFQKNHLEHCAHFCLLALGSYGRRELQLHSDIDLLLLHDEDVSSYELHSAQLFIQDCWDVGLQISHQITTVAACAKLAAQDITVMSSILDMHVLCGRGALMEELLYQTHPLHMWPSNTFFISKRDEQLQRYKKYSETAYNLEPNVKYGPGSLRDLQLLLAIGKRHFGLKKLADGIRSGFITSKEYEELIHCQHFLWRVRFALHFIAEKNEERLLFDYQKKLAELFFYQDNQKSLAIEQFMKDYFKTIKRTRELSDIILQSFSEIILLEPKQKIIPLDESFQRSNQYIEVRHEQVFLHQPETLLRLFLWMAKEPDIIGVRANTVRLIHQYLYLIDEDFRQSKLATQTFIAIIHTASHPYTILQHMNRYGVLGHYLQAFASVTGQMQYDLFHAYTVDQHTLFVIRNITRFHDEKYKTSFSLCAKIMPNIQQRTILYCAALFHDIAKGQGGDHSELGAIEAEKFAILHGLNADESLLLVWLVRHHLLMSRTAQHNDLHDPQNIAAFCQKLPHPTYLDYLYLLTVADIYGTNPKLWNAWKDSLLKELYFAAKEMLHPEHKPLNESALIQLRKQQAAVLLEQDGVSLVFIRHLWEKFNQKYFLYEPPEIIAKHSKAISHCKQYPLVMVMPHYTAAGTEVCIYMPHNPQRFTIATTIMNNLHITTQEATILTNANQYDLDIYVILDEKTQKPLNEQQSQTVQHALEKQLSQQSIFLPITKRRLSRTQAHFYSKPEIVFSNNAKEQYTCLHLKMSDRPGLLAQISHAFLKTNTQLHHAKITTAGERVEDLFYIHNRDNAKLDPTQENQLREQLLSMLFN